MKRKLSANRQSLIQDFAAALRDTVPKTIPSPKASSKEFAVAYFLGDPHFGMYAWKAEAGEDFDLKKAERQTKAAVDNLISRAPDADTGIFVCLGDLIHSDTKQNRTEASGHPLDVDTRWSRVMRVALGTMVYALKRLLRKHKRVVARFCEGNHDPQASYSIALALHEHFRNERRITIDLSPAPAWYHRFGTNLIRASHGHREKLKQLIPLMANDRPKDWGETTCRLAYIGHGHHEEVHGVPGGRAKMCPVLPPNDAWAQGGPWRADRAMFADLLHSKYGRMGEIVCPETMTRGRK